MKASEKVPLRAQLRRVLDEYALGLVGICVGLEASLLAGQALRRFYALHNHTFDLALYSRLAWGLAHGDGWSSVLDQSFFAGHSPLVLLPLGLLGRLFGTVHVLLVAQALAISAAALPIFRLGTLWGGSGLGVAGALAYLLYPNLSHVACYEFHPGNLALPALAYGALALVQGHPRKLAWSCIAVVLCRADLALMTMMMGLLAMIDKDAVRRRRGQLICAASILYFVASTATSVLWSHGMTSAELHFGPWGGNPFGILFKIFSDPALVFAHLFASQRLSYLPRLLAPLLLLPLLAPRYLLLAIPIVAMNLVSVFPTTIELYSHYLTPAVPALVVASMAGIQKLGARWHGAAPMGLVVAAFLGEFYAGGTPWSLPYVATDFRVDAETSMRVGVLAAIPEGVSVQAPDPFLPHLAERRLVHRAPPPDRGTDIVVLDVSHRARFAGTDTLLRTQEEPLVRDWLSRPDYGLILAVGHYLVLERGRDPRLGFSARHFLLPQLITEHSRRLTSCLELLGSQRTDEGVTLQFHVLGPCPNDLALRLSTHGGFSRVDLLFEGLLSPAQLRRGDFVRSVHALPATIRLRELQIGALRSSGARPQPDDPTAVFLVDHH